MCTTTVPTRALYHIGDVCKSGQTISLLLGDSQTASVFTTTDKQLRWEYHLNGGTPPARLMPAVARFNELMGEIRHHVPEATRPQLYSQLGQALHTALDGGELEQCFDAVEERIDAIATQSSRFVYVLACVGSVAIICGAMGAIILLTGNNPLARSLAWGGLAGTVGALMSVLQRTSAIPMERGMEGTHLILVGSTRALLGAVFGAFLVLAATANLVAGVVSDQVLVLMTLAVVAGFSERMVPELLKTLEGGPQTKPTK